MTHWADSGGCSGQPGREDYILTQNGGANHSLDPNYCRCRVNINIITVIVLLMNVNFKARGLVVVYVWAGGAAERGHSGPEN